MNAKRVLGLTAGVMALLAVAVFATATLSGTGVAAQASGGHVCPFVGADGEVNVEAMQAHMSDGDAMQAHMDALHGDGFFQRMWSMMGGLMGGDGHHGGMGGGAPGGMMGR